MLLCIAMLFPACAGLLVSALELPGTTRNRLYAAAALATDFFGILVIAGAGKAVTPVVFTDRLELSFAADPVGKCVLAAVLMLYTAVIFYAFEYMKMEERPHVFFGFLFVSFGALVAVCVSANLVTLYFCFELLTLTTVPLVLHELTKEAIAGGLKYLFYSIGGALMGLLAVFFVYSYSSGSTAFVPGGFLDPAKLEGHEALVRAIIFVGILGFGTKAGLYPMHGWLPTAHPIAPAPASSLLSGIVAKAGVLAIIRLVYFSAGADLIRGTWVQYAWMTLAMLTIFMGSMMAFREKVVKKRLAYSTVSQISYILLGLSLLSDEGFRGGLLHLMGHAAAKGCLFLVAGVFIYKLGYHHVDELKAIGVRMPVTMWCFTIASLSLVGIPPLAGFVSKWVIASGAVSAGMGAYSVLAPVVLLISALLTGGYLLTVVVEAFFPGKEEREKAEEAGSAEPSVLMTVPMAALAAVTLIVGLFGSSILGALGI